MPTTERTVVSTAQYSALQAPVVLPTSQELFDFEVWTLKDKGLGLSEQDVDRLHSLIPNEPQLFVVIPRRPDSLDLGGLMGLIEVDGKTGKNYLDAEQLTDVVDTPTTAHLLLDVEDGRGRLNIKSSVSFENIQQESRVPYTTWHGLVHAITFPCVLQDHYLDLCGSRYKSAFVPYLSLNDSRVPRLRYGWDDNAILKWGAPSAGSRVGA